nr:alkaline phosphatase family protein [Tenacibaculum maritimum]
MNTLSKRILFNIKYFLMWVGYFLITRFLFLLFYSQKTSELDFISILKTFVYGIRLDISFTGYLCLIPFLIVISSIWVSKKICSLLIKGYTYSLLFIINLLVLIDIVLYKSWGVRIDTTLLTYINTPKIMLASISTGALIGSFAIWITSSLLFAWFFNRLINKSLALLIQGKFWEAPFFFVVTAALILPIRGGVQTIPINQSNVYFSTNMFANHAAVNPIWNFSNALTHKVDKKNPYQQYDLKVAEQVINSTKNSLLESSTDTILKTDKPNVILIIWESLSAKSVEVLGGRANVTSNLNKLSKEGILFTNFYGNGDRTDKGLIAILSGYYPQPTKSIIKMPSKTRSLPMLTKEMKNLGYQTSFYYGGDTNFGNMNTYLRNGEVDHVIDGSEFDQKNWNSKWGAHDHIFLERVMNDLSKPLQQPFFTIALTLTSHEPYEFPDEYKFGNDSDENKYLSSQAYTDKAIGKFIEAAKKQSWWNNTLIVIMSDHGHPLPIHKGYFNSPKKFQIPMVWLGGALNKTPIKIPFFSGQTDFSYTLLKLLKGNTTPFKFGKNIFNASDKQYVHYIFNKGFGTIDKNGVFVYDYVSKKPVISTGTSSTKLDSLGRAITQNAFQDFIDR